MSAAVLERPKRRRAPQPLERRLPLEPLLTLIEERGGYAACAPGTTGERERETLDRAWERAKSDGAVPLTAADRLAIRILGLHPMLVWGDDWLD